MALYTSCTNSCSIRCRSASLLVCGPLLGLPCAPSSSCLMAVDIAAGLPTGMLSASCPLVTPCTVTGSCCCCCCVGTATLPDVMDIGHNSDSRLDSAISEVHGSTKLGGCEPVDVASHGSCDLRAMRVRGSLLCWLSQCSGHWQSHG